MASETLLAASPAQAAELGQDSAAQHEANESSHAGELTLLFTIALLECLRGA